eukprot:TRINITY_DN10804_c0_g1_i1.p1 TRINITY_DN10804_c0_g1~~TRINITY_DN10804_c0_g1_i1.p1  ORF type:complete len:114 (+),score=21.61 TRINITY_DN10804_c0_g1_i1:150-491(+)
MSATSTALRRMAQQQRARLLYRKTLKNVLSWAVHREIFYPEAVKVRAEFEQNRVEENMERIDRLISEGEHRLQKKIHPDPYIVPVEFAGSKYNRNPPIPPEIELVYDFGKEEY